MKKLSKNKILLIASIFLISAFLIWCAGIEREGEELSSKVIRLHITADSDKEDDQRLKLLVRDGVLDELAPVLKDCSDSKAAASVINANLDSIRATAEKTLEENNCFLPVSVSIKNELFDEKQYDSFALPSGEYTALRLDIGSGKGHNWWCVVFPPLCLSSAIDQDESILAVLNDDELELITDEGSVVKFRVLELLTRLKEKLSKTHTA